MALAEFGMSWQIKAYLWEINFYRFDSLENGTISKLQLFYKDSITCISKLIIVSKVSLEVYIKSK